MDVYSKLERKKKKDEDISIPVSVFLRAFITEGFLHNMNVMDISFFFIIILFVQ